MFVLNHLRAVRRIVIEFNQKILYSKMSFFDRTPVGRIINRYSEDTFKMDDELSFNMLIFTKVAYIFLTYFISLLILMPWFAAAIFIGIGVVYQFQDRYRASNREIQRLLLLNNSIFTNHVTEALKGIRTIRAFGRESHFLHEFEEAMAKKVKVGFVSQALYYWVTFRAAIFVYLLLLTLAGTCCVSVFYNFDLDYTKVCLGLTYILSGLWLFQNLILFFGSLEKNFIGVERMKQYISNETEDLNEDTNAKIANSDTQSIITFNNVSLSYEQKSEMGLREQKYALKNVSFSIRRGEKVAICGRTGSGKSSIFNVLFRFYDIQQGQITFNGIPIDQINRTSLRERLSIIPQFGFLFKGTLRENLDPKRQISDSTIIEIFKRLGFSLRDARGDKQETSDNKERLTRDYKDDLEFTLENLGSNLSNGEKQIINFLRAFIHAQDIVCLDEANSNIDPETDALLMKALFEICSEKTILMISHRLENLRVFDRIIVLDSGNIVETGSFDELSSNPQSHFNVLRNTINKKE
eukprot:TRINITY_DN6400_c0_g1_i1.p1 TRINITY_DN6400_c0_g1~~TRINITY_DN6400_c0_g1_i1.p1  ORF type:complete len:524 (-),score=87.02 TRINITY_DN6400_c0_g1_i1:126-1697(-)